MRRDTASSVGGIITGTSISGLTPQRVAGALKRAGLDASKSSTTSVRGWHEYSAGFRARKGFGPNAPVHVSYHTGGNYNNKKEETRKVDAMKAVLEKEGFKVELIRDDWNNYLKVNVRG